MCVHVGFMCMKLNTTMDVQAGKEIFTHNFIHIFT